MTWASQVRRTCAVVVGVVTLGFRHGTLAADPRIDDAHDFLVEQHDQFHRSFIVYDDRDSGAARFFPSGWMGDFIGAREPLELFNDAWTDDPSQGTTCIRIRYPRVLRGKGFAGIYWQFSDRNWGRFAGQNIGRYGTGLDLDFDVKGVRGDEVVTFKVGGIRNAAFVSSIERNYRLTRDWQQKSIRVRGPVLQNLVGGFCWVCSKRSPTEEIEFYIDNVRFTLPQQGVRRRLSEPRFVRSYVPQSPRQPDEPDRYFRNTSYIYDNALALLAYIALDDLDHARLIADAVLIAVDHDPYAMRGGFVRNGYMCADLRDPDPKDPGRAVMRLPGWWNDGYVDETANVHGRWEQDQYSLGIDCGNLSWVIIGLLTYWERLGAPPDSEYLDTALELGSWIAGHKRDAGGFTGGRYHDGAKIGWASTEHNIDIAVAFERLAEATNDDSWHALAAHAKAFVEEMWTEDGGGHFWTGTTPEETVNMDNVPLDVHPWAVLAFPDEARWRTGLEWAEKNCGVTLGGRFIGCDFNTDRDGVWWEGTSQMLLAYRSCGEDAKAATYEFLIDRQFDESAEKPAGAIWATSISGLTTGFTKGGDPWVYHRRPHVGATCWAIFAKLAWNPYWAEDSG